MMFQLLVLLNLCQLPLTVRLPPKVLVRLFHCIFLTIITAYNLEHFTKGPFSQFLLDSEALLKVGLVSTTVIVGTGQS